METIKVDLDDGNYAVFYTELKHKTARAVADITRQFLTFADGNTKLGVTLGNKGELISQAKDEPTKLNIDLGHIDWIAVNEAIIINQVSEWSFGEVTAEVLEEQSEKVFDQLKDKIIELYKQVPLAQSAGES